MIEPNGIHPTANKSADRFHRDLEEAAFAAWPAAEETLYDGWLLRFSHGYTKRANSANPVAPGVRPMDEKIQFVETFYHNHGLPSIFRLTQFAPPELDSILESRNYAHLDPTLVLTLDPGRTRYEPPPGITLRPTTQIEWLAAYNEITDATAEPMRKHGEILKRIEPPAYFGLLKFGGEIVACGLAVEHNGLVGLFDLITDPQERRRGFGTQLIMGLSEWGRALGAKRLYLQVMELNLAARRLYAQVGFQVQYRYWYRTLST